MNKNILWFDPSTIAFGYAFLENGVLNSYAKFNPLASYDTNLFGDNIDGYMLSQIKTYVLNLLNELSPNIIGIEDIFSQNIKDYKIMSKVQGAIEETVYIYNKDIKPFLYMARTVRAYFGLNINKMLSAKEYEKYLEKCKRDNKKPRKQPQNHYRDIFSHIDFDQFINFRDSNNKKLKEFDFAKKMVVIDKVNQLYNLNLNYNDNDVADAILSATYLNSIEMTEED